MARPETHRDIETEDRSYQIATFNLEKIADNAALLKHYVSFIEAVQKLHGIIDKKYGATNLTVSLPKSQEDLAVQLKCDQNRWDKAETLYYKVLAGEKIPNYSEYTVNNWCDKEDLPRPEFVKDEDDEKKAS